MKRKEKEGRKKKRKDWSVQRVKIEEKKGEELEKEG